MTEIANCRSLGAKIPGILQKKHGFYNKRGIVVPNWHGYLGSRVWKSHDLKKILTVLNLARSLTSKSRLTSAETTENGSLVLKSYF